MVYVPSHALTSKCIHVSLLVGYLHSFIQEMSAEVVDSNPYSRLMALQRMQIVEKYENIRKFSVAVVGVGGKPIL